VLYGNPIPGELTARLPRRGGRGSSGSSTTWCASAGTNGRAVLTNAVNVGIGTK